MNDTLARLLREAIIDAIPPDRSVGINLSGGLDSSTVSLLAPLPLPAFTGYYEVPGFDERPYARLAARGEHHEIPIRPEDFVRWFDDAAAVLPKGWPFVGAFGQYVVAKYVSGWVDVVLSGEGSDELFGGYARTLLAAGEPMMDGYEHYAPPADYPVGDLAAALQYDLDRLPALLATDDIILAAWGLEGRAPFTDRRVVEYALALPPRERVGKRHLRAAVRGIVPDAIIDRTDKMGFPVPVAIWAQEEPVRSFIGDRIGYLPNPERPFDKRWWHDLLADAQEAAAA